jgi:glutathione transport system substrate-binding protein
MACAICWTRGFTVPELFQLNRKKVMRKLLYALLMTLTLGLCGAGPAWAGGNTLYFGLSGEPSTLDPFVLTGTTWRTVKLTIYRGLVNYGVDGKLSPELAQSYDVAPDGKTLTFHLRDAKFHDDSTVTANDVKATFEHIIAPGSTASFRNQFLIIDHIDVIDPKTVRFVLKQPSVSFIHYLALPEAVIVPAAWLAQHKNDIGTATPIGAGPFKFVRWTRGRELVVKKFDGYYKPGKPYLDEIVFNFYSDENTRVNAIKSGDVDIIDYVPSRSLAELQKNPDVKLKRTLGPFMGLVFNMHDKPLANADVRRAIALTIDRGAIVKTAFDGVGEPIWGLAIPKGYPGYSEANANYYKVDIARARQLMAKAGYPDGFEARLVATSQYSFYSKIAVVLQAQLAQIGIRLKLDMPDWTTQMSKVSSGDYDMALIGDVGEITDPDWLSNYLYGGKVPVRPSNSAYFDDAQIDQLLDEGRATVDPDKRMAIYQKLIDRALDLTPIVFLTWRDQSYAVRRDVTGFTNMPAFLSFQSGYSLENTRMTK